MYWWVGFAVVLRGEPSPKSQLYPTIEPSSLEPLDEKVTVSGTLPLVGLAAATAVGAGFGFTVIVTTVVPSAPSSSVTVSTTE